MKILYCVSSASTIGGITKVTVDKANYLAEVGHDVALVTTEDPNEGILYTLNTSIVIHCLKIGYNQLHKQRLLHRALLLFGKKRRHKKELELFLKEFRPDVIVDTCGLEIPFLNEIKGSAHIVHEVHNHYYGRHLGIEDRYKNIFKQFVFKLAASISLNSTIKKLKQFDKVVVLSEEEKRYWHKLDNVCVIENFLPCRDQIYKSELNAKQVIAAGRLSRMKGFIELVDIWHIISKEHPDWSLVIYGGGDEYENIISRIKLNQLESVVSIFSPVSNIFDKFKESSIFVTTSRLESFGMTVVEAQSSGLPVIAFDCPTGPRGLISNNENGFLVEMGDSNKFASKLSELMNSYELRVKMGEKGYAASKEYSISRIMKKWESLFASL